MQIQKKLCEILKKTKWTQSRLATEIGVSASRLNNWYKGHNLPVADWIPDKIDNLYNKYVGIPTGGIKEQL